MRRLVVIAILALSSWAVVSADIGWVKAVRTIDKSLVHISSKAIPYLEKGIPVLDKEGNLQMVTPTCTGFVIDRLRHYVMTAKHCFGEELKIEGKNARPLYADEFDIMVLEVPGIDNPAVMPRMGNASKGEEIGALGFAYGLGKSLFRHSWISEPSFPWPGEPGPWFTVDSAFVPGMSGGPVFDQEGFIIGIVNQAGENSGWGRPINFIVEKTSFYWQNAIH